MRVAKWGNSLAIRIPSNVVQSLNLEEGSDIVIRVASPREFEIGLDKRRQGAIERLRRLRGQLPADFRFDRREANER